jgi:hypothetical protein
MNLPNISHPKKFEIDGIIFEIITCSSITDEQAREFAMQYFRTHKFKKKDKGKLFQILRLPYS